MRSISQFASVLAALAIMAWLPSVASAAVIISEVAWMGTAESANYEWIELHNTGATDEVVDGWVLDDGNSLAIPLQGTVPAGAYVLLERNRTTGAYLVNPPFQIYTGALINTGAMLRLTDGSGNVVDVTVNDPDTEGWEIGGDNATKDTAQKTAAGWGTGVPTPGAVNAHLPSMPPPEAAESANPNPPTGNSGSKATTGSPRVAATPVSATSELVLVPSISKQVTVGQPLQLGVVPGGVGETILHSLKYSWNFGDGTAIATSGKTVSHTYHYPGTYVVSVRAWFASREQTVTQSVTVLPVTFSFTAGPRGEVQLHNDATYQVDISRYTVIGSDRFVFPANTIMAPKSTITLPPTEVRFSDAGQSSLLDRDGVLLAEYPNLPVAIASTPTGLLLGAVPSGVPRAEVEDRRAAPAPSTVLGQGSSSIAALAAAVPASTTLSPAPSDVPRWPYALLGILVVSSVGVVLLRPAPVPVASDPERRLPSIFRP